MNVLELLMTVDINVKWYMPLIFYDIEQMVSINQLDNNALLEGSEKCLKFYCDF